MERSAAGARHWGFRSARGVYGIATRLTLWVVSLFGLYLSVSLVGNIAAGRMIRARIHDLVLANLEQTDILLSSVLRKARDMGYVLSTNDYLVRYAELSPRPDRNRYQEYQLVRELSLEIAYQANVDPDVSSIYILFADGGQAITSDPDFRSGEALSRLGWVDAVTPVSVAFAYIGHYYDEGLTKRHYLSVVTRADLVNRELKSRVYVAANIDEVELYGTIGRLRTTPGTRAFLVDAEGMVICAEKAADLGRGLEEVVGKLPVPRSSIQRARLGAAGVNLVVERRNETTGWRFVVLLPERELLRGQRTFLALIISFMSAASLVLAVLAARIVAHNIRRPVAALVASMERAEREHFRLRISYDRPDEMGYLFASFNGLVSRTRQLLDDLEQEHLRTREMELKLLQSRMSPHFLYNTLDTINWIAKEHGVDDISRIVVGLSDLYRTMFSRGRDVIEVDRMLRSLESYLYIQTFRYRNLVAYSVEAEPDAGDYLVLNLVVQPVVENAVIHGLAGGVEQGRIDVRASREGTRLRFRVADNGAGMSAEKLDRIKANMASDAGGEASGLRNIQMRLGLFYGPACELTLRSQEGGGTVVDIVLPISCPFRGAGATP